MFRDRQSGVVEESEAVMYRIHSGRNVMMRPGYKHVVEKIKSLVNVSDEVFEHTYKAALDRYAQFVQSLPLPRDKHKTLMLDQGLRRGLGVLKHYAPKVRSNNGFGFDEGRLLFAMFSASLLYGIGRVCQDRTIVQCSEQGRYIKTWYPNSGPMDQGFYKIRIAASQGQDFVVALHHVYAQVVLPNMCLSWLLEDERLYLMWRNALEDFQTGFSDFEIDLNLDLCAELVAKEVDLALESEQVLPPEMMEGEQFWAWLKEKIKGDPSVVNKEGSGIVHVKEGMLLDLDLLTQEYMQTKSSMSSNMGFVAKQFGAMGIAATGMYQTVSRSSSLFSSKQASGKMALIDRDSRLFNHNNLKTANVAIQSSMKSDERFFARLSGTGQQIMQGYTTGK